MAAAEALGGPRSSQGSQYFWQRGLAYVPGHTLSCTHKLTYPYSRCMRRDPRPLTHVSCTHSGTGLCSLLSRSTLAGVLKRRPTQRSTQTHARYTIRVSSYPPLPDRHNTDSHHLGDGRLRNTPSHTARHIWPRPRDGQTLETVSDSRAPATRLTTRSTCTAALGPSEGLPSAPPASARPGQARLPAVTSHRPRDVTQRPSRGEASQEGCQGPSRPSGRNRGLAPVTPSVHLSCLTCEMGMLREGLSPSQARHQRCSSPLRSASRR